MENKVQRVLYQSLETCPSVSWALALWARHGPTQNWHQLTDRDSNTIGPTHRIITGIIPANICGRALCSVPWRMLGLIIKYKMPSFPSGPKTQIGVVLSEIHDSCVLTKHNQSLEDLHGHGGVNNLQPSRGLSFVLWLYTPNPKDPNNCAAEVFRWPILK